MGMLDYLDFADMAYRVPRIFDYTAQKGPKQNRRDCDFAQKQIAAAALGLFSNPMWVSHPRYIATATSPYMTLIKVKTITPSIDLFVLEGHDELSYCAFVANQAPRINSSGKVVVEFHGINIVAFNLSESDQTIMALV